MLNRYHFTIERESRIEGTIETQYRTGSGLLEPWHPDSVDFSQKLESSLQSIRRKVTVSIRNTSAASATVAVRVDKEVEDLPGLAANYEGGATFNEAQLLDRDLSQVVGQSSPSRWVPLGRDTALEAALLREILSSSVQ